MRLFNTARVHTFHIEEIYQRSKNRFYCAASFFHNAFCIFALQFYVHLIIERFVYAVVYFFELCFFATAGFSERTFAAILFAAAVDFLCVSFAVGGGFLVG